MKPARNQRECLFINREKCSVYALTHVPGGFSAIVDAPFEWDDDRYDKWLRLDEPASIKHRDFAGRFWLDVSISGRTLTMSGVHVIPAKRSA